MLRISSILKFRSSNVLILCNIIFYPLLCNNLLKLVRKRQVWPLKIMSRNLKRNCTFMNSASGDYRDILTMSQKAHSLLDGIARKYMSSNSKEAGRRIQKELIQTSVMEMFPSLLHLLTHLYLSPVFVTLHLICTMYMFFHPPVVIGYRRLIVIALHCPFIYRL